MFTVQPPFYLQVVSLREALELLGEVLSQNIIFFIRYFLIYSVKLPKLQKLQKESLLIKIQYSFKIANMNNRGGC